MQFVSSAAVVALGFAGVTLLPGAHAEHKVVYKVTATGGLHVEYGDLVTGRKSADASKKWSKTVNLSGWNGVGINVSATDSADKPNTKVTCEIYVNGKLMAVNSATGAGANTTCLATSFL